MKKKTIENKDHYFLFIRKPNDRLWIFAGKFETKEECECDMEQSGEPEGLEYKIIKGRELGYEEGVPRFPYVILEEEK